ncbi:MAG: restriction endonuclease subunit S, partial [Desulfobulbaceae bacterium]|nr:restriction endonuclease subunit S [Desulfobulbaceae bacterium]
MERYGKYKDSGVEWIGEIPEGWEVLRLRFLSKIKTGDKDTENREDNGKYPFYVRSQTIEHISTYSYDGEAILTAGDGVGVGKVFHYVNGKFDYHQRVYKISDFVGIIAKYLFYYMKLNFHKGLMIHREFLFA